MIKMSADMDVEDIILHSKLRHATLKSKLYSSESESDVRQAFLALYDLDLVGNLEKHRVDYAHKELWIEVKYNGHLDDLDCRCRVIGQMLHYLRDSIVKRSDALLPDSFAIADKNRVMIYTTLNFFAYIANPAHYEGIKNPSSKHPSLERALRTDPLVTTRMYHPISEYEDLWSEFEKRGLYEALKPIPAHLQPEHQPHVYQQDCPGSVRLGRARTTDTPVQQEYTAVYPISMV